MGKKVNLFIWIMVLIVFNTFVSCKSNDDEVIIRELDVSSIMVQDYEYIDSVYDDFHFYETNVHFDTAIRYEFAKIDGVRTVFQVKDTCIIFNHYLNKTDTLKVKDYWTKCCDIEPRCYYGFYAAFDKLGYRRNYINTNYVTYRRPPIKPYPQYGWWIFGDGEFVIDSKNCEFVKDVVID